MGLVLGVLNKQLGITRTKKKNGNPQLNTLRRRASYQQKNKQTNLQTQKSGNHIEHLAPATCAYTMTAATTLNKNENQNNAALQTSHIRGGTKVGCSGNYTSIYICVFV